MRPPPLRTIVSSQALMSSLTDAVGTEMVYDTVLYPQLNQDTLGNHVEISVFYISIVVSIVNFHFFSLHDLFYFCINLYINNIFVKFKN